MKRTAFQEWEERCEQELKLLFSPMGEELQLCLVAQGYEKVLSYRLMVLFGSGFTAFDIIKSLKEEINKK